MTTVNYLTHDDVQNYGNELTDFAQRAALHAVAPQLTALEQQNAELQRRLAVEARHNLDRRVAEAVPNYQQIDQDPRWHAWLRGVDTLTGRPRQVLLNDAIQSTDAGRVAAFFRKFQSEAGGGTPAAAASASGGRARSSGNRQTYTRPQIAQLYESHRKGQWTGREAEWARLEVDLIAAGREGRIVGGVDFAGK